MLHSLGIGPIREQITFDDASMTHQELELDSTLEKAVDTETGEILRPFIPLGP